MLVDLHLTPRDLAPQALAAAARSAGLHGVVITDTNRTDRLSAYVDAAHQAGLAAYAGVELALTRGFLVFIPKVVNPEFLAAGWSAGSGKWAPLEAIKACAAVPGVIIAGHPYCRDLESILFDHVFTLPNLSAIETRVARGRPLWDAMADDVATRRNLPRVGSCGGDPAFVGRAVTYVQGERLSQAGLVDAILEGNVWPIEFEARGQSRPHEEEFVEAPRRHDEEGAEGEGGEPRDDDRPRRGPRSDGDRPRRDGRGGDRGGSRGPRRRD